MIYKTQLNALKLKQNYNLQFYDALIVSTALKNSCTILYSEDMQDKLVIEKKIKIINPFNIKIFTTRLGFAQLFFFAFYFPIWYNRLKNGKGKYMHTVKLKINDDIYNHIMFF